MDVGVVDGQTRGSHGSLLGSIRRYKGKRRQALVALLVGDDEGRREVSSVIAA